VDALRDTLALLPVLVVLLGAVVVLLADVFARYEEGEDGEPPAGARSWLMVLTVGTLLAALACTVWMWSGAADARSVFHGTVVLDRFALFFDGVILLGSGLSCLLAPRYLDARGLARGEFYGLALLGVAGMLVMAHSGDLIVLFVGLETMSVAVYALTAYLRGDPRSAEAGLKYFLLGAFASAILLYGIALLWGVTGTTRLDGIAGALAGTPALAADPLTFVGMLFVLVGFGFKVALVPFHMWTPDVYEGAPAPVTAYMASAVKAAGFAVLVRVLVVSLSGRELALAPGPGAAPVGWFQILIWLSILTMTVGNTLALVQTNIKRMLAYSSIAHAGYAAVALPALVPLLGNEPAAPGAAAAVLFYVLAYAVGTVGAFGALSLVQRDGEELTDVRDLHGLSRRHPALAIAFTLFLLSLAGLPPTAGFMAKLQVFAEALAAGDALHGYGLVLASGHDVLYWLVVIAALNSVLAVVYYLRPVVAMYMRPARDHWQVLSGPAITVALLACALLTLWLGLLPGDAVAVAREAAAGLTP